MPDDSERPTAPSNPVSMLAALRGGWVQRVQPSALNHADYAPGGYQARVLLFRGADPSVQVICAYGEGLRERVSGTLSMEPQSDGRMQLGRRPGGGDPFEMLPSMASPAVQTQSRMSWKVDGSVLSLGDKTFDRMLPQDVTTFITGGPLRQSSATDVGPSLAGVAWKERQTLLVLVPPSQASNSAWSSLCERLRTDCRTLPADWRVAVVSVSGRNVVRWRSGRDPEIIAALGQAESLRDPSDDAVLEHAMAMANPGAGGVILAAGDPAAAAAMLRRASGRGGSMHVFVLTEADAETVRGAHPGVIVHRWPPSGRDH